MRLTTDLTVPMQPQSKLLAVLLFGNFIRFCQGQTSVCLIIHCKGAEYLHDTEYVIGTGKSGGYPYMWVNGQKIKDQRCYFEGDWEPSHGYGPGSYPTKFADVHTGAPCNQCYVKDVIPNLEGCTNNGQ